MNNLDYWQAIVGDTAPEDFMRTYGSMDPELCVNRFLEDRGHLFGVVNQGSWQGTFRAPEQFHRLTVRIYLLSYLDETREEWRPALEAKPPSIPRRYREKFDQDKYPPPDATDQSSDPDAGDVEVESGEDEFQDGGNVHINADQPDDGDGSPWAGDRTEDHEDSPHDSGNQSESEEHPAHSSEEKANGGGADAHFMESEPENSVCADGTAPTSES